VVEIERLRLLGLDMPSSTLGVEPPPLTVISLLLLQSEESETRRLGEKKTRLLGRLIEMVGAQGCVPRRAVYTKPEATGTFPASS